VQATFGCNPRWEAGAIARFRPDVVFWIINSPADAMLYRDRWLDTCSESYAVLYERSLRKELAILGSHGAKVVIPTEVYPRYLFAHQDQSTDCENRIRRNVVAGSNVQLIDLNGFICPKHRCREKQDGVILRTDGEHYEGEGGRIVAQWLLDQVG
jgi:hypothetical protein